MMYPTLYDYFKDVVIKPEMHVLEGEEMERNPTQHQASDALKKVWEKLGGSFKIALLALLPTLSLSADPVTRGTLWYDVPPETPVSNVVDLASLSGGISSNDVINITSNAIDTTYLPARTRLGSYLWEVGTEKEDHDKATNRFAKVYPSFGACSGFCTTSIHGRNFDWYYNKQVSTVIRKPETGSSLGFIGVGDGILTEEFIASGAWTNAYWAVPYSLSDGMNTRGVVIQQNVLYKKPYSEWPSGSVDWKTKRDGCVIMFDMIRYALERAKTAYKAAKIIRDYNFIPAEFGYDMHYLVSDTTSSYIVEDGKIYSIEDGVPVDAITNFRIGGVTFDEETKKVDWNTVEPYGMGVERYDLLREIGGEPRDYQEMFDILKNLWYTKAYTDIENPWRTEFCTPGHTPDLTVQNAKSNPSYFDSTLQQAREDYRKDHDAGTSYYRTGLSWQTVHMSVYDKGTLTLYLYTQENEESKKTLKIGGPASWAMAGETITTMQPFKSNWRSQGGTMDELVTDICNDPSAVEGMCFLGEIASKDKMPDVRLGNFEAIVKICESGVVNFEALSTDTGTKHWDGVGINGEFLGWRQVVTAPEMTTNGSYVIRMDVTGDGQSKDYYWTPYLSEQTVTGIVEHAIENLASYKPLVVDNRNVLVDNSVLSMNPTNSVYYFNNLTEQTSVTSLGFSATSITEPGVYTWELILSSNKDITSMTFNSVAYVGNDSSYNPGHAFSRIDNSRTSHVFSVRLIKTGSMQKWQIAYCYSFKD